MINREITYQRNVSTSYMIIPAMKEENMDERILLKKRVEGLLSVEKCFSGAQGQYWYDITGKQALDAYCRMNSIGKDLFRNIMMRLCQTVEKMEWCLMDVNCLVLDPELIFCSVYQMDVFFVAYPYHTGNFVSELQQLLEYILTKLDHKDSKTVENAYKIYEMTLTESIGIEEIRQVLMEELEYLPSQIKERNPQIRTEVGSKKEETPKGEGRRTGDGSNIGNGRKVVDERRAEGESKAEDRSRADWKAEKKSAANAKETGQKKTLELAEISDIDTLLEYIKQKGMECYEQAKAGILEAFEKNFAFVKWKGAEKKNDMEKTAAVTYPEEEEMTKEIQHPTVYIGAVLSKTAELFCDRHGAFPDYELKEESYLIGKGEKMQIRIRKETISHIHAKIEYRDGNFYLEDLNSTNGTYVNGSPLSYKSEVRLQSGDAIRFADVGYHFCFYNF